MAKRKGGRRKTHIVGAPSHLKHMGKKKGGKKRGGKKKSYKK